MYVCACLIPIYVILICVPFFSFLCYFFPYLVILSLFYFSLFFLFFFLLKIVASSYSLFALFSFISIYSLVSRILRAFITSAVSLDSFYMILTTGPTLYVFSQSMLFFLEISLLKWYHWYTIACRLLVCSFSFPTQLRCFYNPLLAPAADA